jgi:spore coat polysaccharide biosynthesis protein SpsF|tara:strand:- start:497 stop:1243 length:747 start_codon:yes stop_codon:yes gene_type:complete
MSFGAFIVARLSSRRLKQKHMLEILGKPMIEQMICRVAKSKMLDTIILTTSTDSTDDQLENLANELNIRCYRGPLNNIMERVTGAANAFGCDTIVELLGDNPLVHSELIDDVIKFFIDGGYDYATNVTSEYPLYGLGKQLFPIGIRVQVYSTTVANRYREFPGYINNSSKHPCSFLFDYPNLFDIGYFEAKGPWSFLNKPDLNFAVNYQNDLNRIREIFENCYYVKNNFSLNDVIQYLNIYNFKRSQS